MTHINMTSSILLTVAMGAFTAACSGGQASDEPATSHAESALATPSPYKPDLITDSEGKELDTKPGAQITDAEAKYCCEKFGGTYNGGLGGDPEKHFPYSPDKASCTGLSDFGNLRVTSCMLEANKD